MKPIAILLATAALFFLLPLTSCTHDAGQMTAEQFDHGLAFEHLK